MLEGSGQEQGHQGAMTYRYSYVTLYFTVESVSVLHLCALESMCSRVHVLSNFTPAPPSTRLLAETITLKHYTETPEKVIKHLFTPRRDAVLVAASRPGYV